MRQLLTAQYVRNPSIPVEIADQIIVYFLCGLALNAGAFFVFLITIICSYLAMTVFFRTIGCVCPDFDYAMKFAAILITLFVLTGGYFIQYHSELAWLRWIFWVNPFALGFSVLMMNEFSRISLQCVSRNLVPSGVEEYSHTAYQVCMLPGSVPGSAFVSGTDYIKTAFSYNPAVMWRNFGIIIVMIVAFLFLQASCAEFLQYTNKGSVSHRDFHSKVNTRICINKREDLQTVDHEKTTNKVIKIPICSAYQSQSFSITVP